MMWSAKNMQRAGDNSQWKDTDRGKPVPVCPPQNPQGLAWNCVSAYAVTYRRQTAWVTARPKIVKTSIFQ